MVLKVIILILLETPLQCNRKWKHVQSHTGVIILILLETPLQCATLKADVKTYLVIILILLETPLQ